MHLASDAVTYEVSYYAVAFSLDRRLDSVTDVRQSVARFAELERREESCLCRIDQMLVFLTDLADSVSPCGITDISLVRGTDIHADDVAFLEYPLGIRNAVHDFLVDGSAYGCRITLISLESRDHAVRCYDMFYVVVDVFRRDARLDKVFEFPEDVPCDFTGFSHQLYFLFALDYYHNVIHPVP